MSQKDKLTEVLVIAGLAAFAYYKYSKLTEVEKSDIQEDLKEAGKKIVKEFIPEQILPFLPAVLK